MAIDKETEKLLDIPIPINILWVEENGEINIDRDSMVEALENAIDDLVSDIDVIKCGFCGVPLEEDIRYCSSECCKADNTERV